MTTPSPEQVEAISLQAAQMAAGLHRAGRLADAADLYERALKLNPGLTPAWCNLGVARRMLGDIDGARIAFERALSLQPAHPSALANLASVLMACNEPARAREVAQAALSASPDQAAPRLVLARLARGDGDPAEALALLEPLSAAAISADLAPRLYSERGMALDRLGRCEEAFEAFTRANLTTAESAACQAVDPRSYPRTVAMVSELTPAILATDHARPAPDRPPPIFVLGFPRSGTTLTETILSAHPALRGSDEIPLLESVLARLSTLLPERGVPYPDAFAGAPWTEDELAVARAAYWEEAERAVAPGEGRLVDKLPLNMVHLGAIATLFPDAPVIAVLRDPRDVCLSCFMQDFVPNSAMVQLLSLETTVDLQERVMQIWLDAAHSLPNPTFTVRYEEVVADQRQTGRDLLAFLGLPWHEGVSRFWESARGVHISTPSHQDVARPIFTRARGRWRRYEMHLAPVLPRLHALAQALGYEGGFPETDNDTGPPIQ